MPMRAPALFAPVVALALLAGACAQGGATAPPAPTRANPAAPPAAAGDAGRGKVVFTQTCSSCHGADARGLPGVGKDLTNNAFIKGQSDSDLIAFIKKGRPASDPANTTKVDMPPKGGNPAITDAQLADVAAYLRSLQQ
jgi:mono/diheme cytochrome c family protein